MFLTVWKWNSNVVERSLNSTETVYVTILQKLGSFCLQIEGKDMLLEFLGDSVYLASSWLSRVSMCGKPADLEMASFLCLLHR